MLLSVDDVRRESHSTFYLGRHADFVILIQLVLQNLVQFWAGMYKLDGKDTVERSWVFVALATESVDWVGNESKVSLFTVPVFFLFRNEYCSYVFKHLEHEFRKSLFKYLAESSY